MSREPTEGSVLPPSRRRPVLVLAGIAVASVIGIIVTVNAATSARSSARPATAANATSTTAPRFVDDGSLTAPRSYRGGQIALVPPPIGTRPRVTAGEAFAQRGSYAWRNEPPEPHVVLAVATISPTIVPSVDERLVWVITYDHVAGDDIGHVASTTTAATTTTSVRGAAEFTVLSFVDAATGKHLGTKGFANATSPAKCVSEPIIGKSYLSPNGAKSAQQSPGAATIYHFADGNQQLVVPDGFDPLRAGDLTLFVFGFPPRPHEPAARKQWEDEFRNYRGSPPVGETHCTN